MQKQFITDKINIEKYFELLNINPDIIIKENSKLIENIETIEFKDVCFAYPKRSNNHDSENEASEEYILNGVNFKIESGQKVAFVGESGSGKSTIANLIRRSFDPQMGEIWVNGHPLKKLDNREFLRKIGSVDQEIILFDRSVRDNISFGCGRKLSDQELGEIIKLSGVELFIHKLEHGVDTIIGERGAKLSGGERQRIGIARALAKRPEILIFDEAPSALDSKSEKQVSKSIEKSSSGKTSIIITHRLSTALGCDKIFVMRAGNIVDSGRHEELLERCDYYRELIKGQLSPKSEAVRGSVV
jgi:ABC-type multidrug transport system fused ATPase/permease subunit